MGISVQKISFTGNLIPNNDKKEKVQDAATVAGGTGFVAKATNIASKQGLKTVHSTMDAATEAAQMASKGIKEGSGYIARFRSLTKKYYGDAISFLGKFKDNKLIRPIIKSPIAKGAATAFGGTLAFFVLISGIAEAAESGNSAFSDMRNKYYMWKNM